MIAPIALFIYNRPDLTRRVFAAIREARPDRLLIVGDGPRNAADALAVRETRSTICVDWPCEVDFQITNQHLGCRWRVSSGIDWVFSRVSEAIVLEDDCLPHPSFFRFCTELLDYYRRDSAVGMIAGSALEHVEFSSYGFSRFFHIWGWATWARAWRHYDVNASAWPEFDRKHGLVRVFPKERDERNKWRDLFERVYWRRIDTWDYQWQLAGWIQGLLSIVPARNLVSNIGYDSRATHTTEPGPFSALPLESLDFPLVHPRGNPPCQILLPGV